ncbi:helix-turn-helix domain-containing protein [Pengzhenrongella sicca]|uniref:Helix-turn-helix domain-containing protein n=1 Tax=Pengzhenrongella sicca TaxID=2819238 RepID=A0A8A4Z9P6_9MICO|nr:helix-turn-helix domain-containing protein [Pengzhenrongella sicca]QTE28195.1 helix-turn-helix domain-containing protein [Pengzhenrongella sicca]
MLKNVVAVVYDGVGSFGLGVVSEVFGYDRSAAGLPSYDFAVVAEQPGTVRTDTGLLVVVEHGLERMATADLVCVLGWERADIRPSEALLEALRETVARGGRIMSHCSGAFVVAAAGLLDGRTVATHWMHAAELARLYPAVTVDADVLYVDDDPIFSSAGTAAGIDACLYLLRLEHGATVANAVARRMVVSPHRDGGQAQFITASVPEIDDRSLLRETLTWALGHLDTDLTVDELARRALMSPRSFARHFRTATGSTPHAWLLAQRVTLAQQLLEGTDLAVDEVARRSGLGAATTLRHHFALRVGTSPQAYRRTFRGRQPGVDGELATA